MSVPTTLTFLLEDPMAVWMEKDHQWSTLVQDNHASPANTVVSRLNVVVLLLLAVGAIAWIQTPTINVLLLMGFALVVLSVFWEQRKPLLLARKSTTTPAPATTTEGFTDSLSEFTVQNPFGNPNQVDVQERPTRASAAAFTDETRKTIYAAAVEQLRRDPNRAHLARAIDAGDPQALYILERSLYSFHSVPCSSVVNEGQDALYEWHRRSSARTRSKEAAVTRYLKN